MVGHDHAHPGHDRGPSSTKAGGHNRAHAPANFDRTFAIGVGLNMVFVTIEAAYGVISDSLAFRPNRLDFC